MDDFDSTWCPVCSRQIVPKRIPAPVVPLPSNAPPASPAPQPIPSNDTSARLPHGKAGGTIRPRPQGLVHGTGRVRPNGTIKRSPPLHTLPSKPVTPVRRRTVIDQTPAPLYCSDECQLADLQSIHGAIDIKYHPDRCSSPSLPPVPPNSVSDYQSSQEDSDSSSGASYDSRSSISSPTLVPAPASPAYPSHRPRIAPTSHRTPSTSLFTRCLLSISQLSCSSTLPPGNRRILRPPTRLRYDPPTCSGLFRPDGTPATAR